MYCKIPRVKAGTEAMQSCHQAVTLLPPPHRRWVEAISEYLGRFYTARLQYWGF